jgi:hypothetical protein
MNKRNQMLSAGIGLWASGMLIGANAIGYLPGDPSWPPPVILALGLLITLGCSKQLLKLSQ